MVCSVFFFFLHFWGEGGMGEKGLFPVFVFSTGFLIFILGGWRSWLVFFWLLIFYFCWGGGGLFWTIKWEETVLIQSRLMRSVRHVFDLERIAAFNISKIIIQFNFTNRSNTRLYFWRSMKCLKHQLRHLTPWHFFKSLRRRVIKHLRMNLD